MAISDVKVVLLQDSLDMRIYTSLILGKGKWNFTIPEGENYLQEPMPSPVQMSGKSVPSPEFKMMMKLKMEAHCRLIIFRCLISCYFFKAILPI